MTWVAIADLNGQSEAPTVTFDGYENNPDALLTKGSFVAETLQADQSQETIRILRYDSPAPWKFRFSLRQKPDGSYCFEMHLAGAAITLHTPPDPERQGRPARFLWTWDAPARKAFFSVRDLTDGSAQTVACDAPFPLPLPEILGMARATSQRSEVEVEANVSSEVLHYFAFSDEQIMPGPAPSIAQDTPVETARGPVEIRALRPGDLIVTRDNGLQPLMGVLQGEVPALGWFRPLRFRAPYYDLTRDIVVSPGQRFLIVDDVVEYLFGEDEVLADAAQLSDGQIASEEIGKRTVTYFQLVLTRHEIISVAGSWVDSVWWPATLSGAVQTAEAPAHKHAARPILKPFEALTLCSMRRR